METTGEPLDFEGTERFTVLRRLGQGGMGVVYLAHDRVRDTRVALKTLRRVDPAAIWRLKQEFRALADLVHPNLVALHELFSAGNQWFFTMELVDGVDFLRWVRADAPPPEVSMSAETLPAAALEDVAAAPGAEADPLFRLDDTGPDIPRLRAALLQLAEGVAALHAAGKLHRDIKPSNVMVTPEGRVLLLDFGLVTELGARPLEHGISGTIEYMAPEQADNAPPVPASDWYSVGVMLYQALTGRLPFTGAPLKVLIDKRRVDPPPPSEIAPETPADLERLCLDLMNRDPAARPDDEEILRRLRGGETPKKLRTTTGPLLGARTPGGALPLVGRERHLSVLEEALATSRRGRGLVMLVHGSSGMGKSALVRKFLDDVAAREDAVVLAGRCYERESVPYKALDSVIDALTTYLLGRPSEEVAALLPPDAPALARLFPVLRRIPDLAAVEGSADGPDPREVRRRAFGALRELWGRLAERRVVVVYIDDLQWGDTDSAELLAEVLRYPEPPILLLGTYRTEEADSSAFLRTFRAQVERRDPPTEVSRLQVGPLDPSKARDLALTLLGTTDGAAMAGAAAIAREAGGNPFFVESLVRYLASGAAERRQPSRGLTLAEMIRARAALLPAETRRLLRVVCVAARPLPRTVALAAALVTGDADKQVALLRADHWIRARTRDGQEALEPYHDRIRELVVAALDPEARRDDHRAVALALERAGTGDPETLAEHFREAGDLDRVRHYTVEAAARAARALAFDRAAALYERALELHRARGGDDERARNEERRLLTHLGDALANAARGPDAARWYREAAALASGPEAVELRRRAGEQLLMSGHVDEGLVVLEQVLTSVGLQVPPTPRRALASLVSQRARFRLRGWRFRPRDARQVPSAELTRIDACWSVAIGLGLVDHVRAADFQTRSLLLALASGERYRIARALAMEAAYASAAGPSGRARADRLAADAERLANEIDHPHALGLVRYGRGVSAFLTGRWAEGVSHLRQAETFFREQCTGVAWEQASTEIFLLSALAFLGRVDEIAERVPARLEEARDRGNKYFATSLLTGYPALSWLVRGQPAEGRRQMERAMQEWSQGGFHVQHYYNLVSETHLDLYEGIAERPWRRICEVVPQLEAAMVDRVYLVRIDALSLRGRCALAAAAAGVDADEARAVARRDARTLLKARGEWARPLGALLSATLDAQLGREAEAAAALESVAADFDRLDMRLHAMVARRRRGQLLGGDEGAALVARADAEMTALGIGDPALFAAIYAPGFPET